MLTDSGVEGEKSSRYHLNDDPGQPVEERMAELGRALALVEAQRHELEHALHMRDESQRQLEAQLEDARLLQSISAMLIDEHSVSDLYQRLVDAATLVMHSDFGSMQRYDAGRDALQLIAHNGLDEESVLFWGWVHAGRATTCGRALQVGRRVTVPDFEACDFIAGSDDLVAFRKAGVKSAQSTPLLTREGRLVGMITTHWTSNHEPPERDLRLLDIVARQAADLIERNTSAETLRRHASDLLDADRYKNEFLATLAHELRNPLAPIRTGLEVLKTSPEQLPHVVSMMDRQLVHMVRLVDDLLDVSRISRGMITLKRAPVELRTIVESAVEASRPAIDAFAHNFNVIMPATPVWLDADATRVAQILNNLLNNAAKYTPSGGTLSLVAEVADHEIAIRVADSGIGIAAEMLPRVFDLFTQVDRSSERSQSGLGVGLALARRLAEMHAGSLAVESAGVQRGSVFTLRLPTVAAPAVTGTDGLAGNAMLPDLPEDGARRILIVDDNEDAAEMMAMLLEELGHVTRVVTDSRTAVDAACDFLPHVALLDIGMPHLNGFEVARAMREQAALEGMCLAAVSGWGTEEDRTLSKNAGIDYHLTKPVMMSEITGLLSARLQ